MLLDISKIDWNTCIPIGLVLFFFLIIALGKPRDTLWKEHCPYCNENLGSKFKGEKPAHCKKCGRDIYFTKPHSS